MVHIDQKIRRAQFLLHNLVASMLQNDHVSSIVTQMHAGLELLLAFYCPPCCKKKKKNVQRLHTSCKHNTTEVPHGVITKLMRNLLKYPRKLLIL